jgi:hypothetical protein
MGDWEIPRSAYCLVSHSGKLRNVTKCLRIAYNTYWDSNPLPLWYRSRSIPLHESAQCVGHLASTEKTRRDALDRTFATGYCASRHLGRLRKTVRNLKAVDVPTVNFSKPHEENVWQYALSTDFRRYVPGYDPGDHPLGTIRPDVRLLLLYIISSLRLRVHRPPPCSYPTHQYCCMRTVLHAL